MAQKVIKVFHANGCQPCKEVTERLERGRFASDLGDVGVELVDITTEEGFAEVIKEQLEKVPTAKYEGKTCEIRIDEELDAVMLTCQDEPEGTPAAEAESKDTPAPAS